MPTEDPCEEIRKINYYYSSSTYQWISIPICFIGAIFNLLNVLVFTRKTMNSPSNRILAHLAFADFLVLLSYIPNSLLWNIDRRSDFCLAESHGWTIFYWYNDIFTSTFQFISIFLTVQLAVWRYIAVAHPLKERSWCSMRITRNAMIAGYVVCCVLYAVPFHLSFDIETIDKNQNTNARYKFTIGGHPIMYQIRCYIYGLVIKLLPSVALVGLTFKIVVVLLARKRHHKQLTAQSNMKNLEMRQQTNKLTAILLTVVVLFFIGEFPRGMIWLLGMINEHRWDTRPGHYWDTRYDSLVRIFVTIAHINTSITFIVYYILSQQFRSTFKSFFSRNPQSITHQTHKPLVLGDSENTNSERKTFEF
ncbi:FMRFamide peptide receptor frpr-18-like [Planococcus citri]|uniref:FMRFamide peptide receptor frpr-18-like n=1 Tax=Planococcus citri TaxID=170843 RepID=UPI0031F965A8